MPDISKCVTSAPSLAFLFITIAPDCVSSTVVMSATTGVSPTGVTVIVDVAAVVLIFLRIALLQSLAIAHYYCVFAPSSSQKSTHSKRGILKRERYILQAHHFGRLMNHFLLPCSG